jgi:hypothetical protein
MKLSVVIRPLQAKILLLKEKVEILIVEKAHATGL